MKRQLSFGVTTLGLMIMLVAAGCGGGGGSQNLQSPAPAVTVNVTGSAQVRLGSTAQYSATVNNSNNQSVIWQVNGVAGGDGSVGVITAAGLYTPPAALPSGASVRITAVSEASASASASMTVALLNPQPVIRSAATDGYGATGSSYLVSVTGSGFLPNSVISVNGSPLTTTYVSSQSLTAVYALSAPGDGSINVSVANPDPGASTATTTAALQQATAAAAARLLDQSSFGPTLETIAEAQRVGLSAYLDEQFNAQPTQLAEIPTPLPAQCNVTNIICMESEWWRAALTGDDQLRQRVAFALSQIMVTSNTVLSGNATVNYVNMLNRDAFANFRVLMQDVTLSPAMGWYLNMANSKKAAASVIVNENYARELMQLFTLGLFELNSDGTQKLDGAGKPIPTYTEEQLEDIARAFTGWTFSKADGSAATTLPTFTYTWKYPMQAVAGYHDATAKTILGGVRLNAGQSAEEDLQQTLDAIFNHPNVGPFVCKQLIQHLVSSSPSPEYVGRVAAVFADNGAGVRGDMKAVVRAILLDPEARANDAGEAVVDGGHLREPTLYISAIMRGLNYVVTSNAPADYAYTFLTAEGGALGERPMYAPSVFNFYPIGYKIPTTELLAPEFGLENVGAVIQRLKLADKLVANALPGLAADLRATSPLGKLAASDPQALVDALNKLFMHSQMSAEMNSLIVNHVAGIANNPEQRVRVAVYLIITSSQYKVIH